MKKIAVIILALCMLSGTAVTVYADQSVTCNFSKPMIAKKDGNIFYTTLLSVPDAESMEGYQIEIEAENEDSIVIQNKSGGTATKNVYKDGRMNLAVMSGGTSGNGSLCEITVKYPFADKNHNRLLRVSSLQIVTSVSEEKIETGGPFTLELPYVEPPFYANLKFYLLLALTVLAALGAAFCMKKRMRKQAECL